MLNIVKFDGFMVFNTTFNNISLILWQSVLLVEETGVHRENHRPFPQVVFIYITSLFINQS